MKADEIDTLLRAFKRLELRFEAYRANPGDEAERIALIDDLRTARRRLLDKRDEVGGQMRKATTSRAATSAYASIHRIRT